MRIVDRQLTNLTKAQVEALLQCFDFFTMGYEEQSCFEVGDLWVIQMKHKRTQKLLRMFIHPNSYRLQAGGHTRKKVTFASSSQRYELVVNSDASVGVVRLNAYVRPSLISG